MRKLAVAPESDLANSIRQASRSGEPLLLDTGEALYRVHVDCEVAPEESGTQVARTTPSHEEAARSIDGIRRSAGGWHNLDAEALKSYFRQRRRASRRPRVQL